jgi:hypothetical protein
VTNNMAEFCLGCIGMDERHFLSEHGCNIVAHKKQCYELNCQEGFYIPTATHRALGQPSVFQAPFLDASRMTPGVRQVVMDPEELDMKTTRKWEEFILQANVVWHAYQEEEWKRFCGIHEGLEKDDLSTSGIHLPDEPGTFKFVKPQVFGDIEFATHPKLEEGAVGYRAGGEKVEDSCKELDKIRSVVKQLNNKLSLLVVSVRSN